MVLKDGWLNRQLDQVSKNVDRWPAWMKHAAGFDSEAEQSGSQQPGNEPSPDSAKGSHQLKFEE